MPLGICGERNALARRSVGIARQHDVGLGVRTQDADRLSVRRVPECGDRVRREAGQLAAGRAIQRLEPQVVRAVIANGIYDALAVRTELWRARNARIGIEHALRRLRSRIQRHQSDLVCDVSRTARREERQQLAIGCDGESIIEVAGGKAVPGTISGDPPSMLTRLS
jgi:hypothetical protein